MGLAHACMVSFDLNKCTGGAGVIIKHDLRHVAVTNHIRKHIKEVILYELCAE